MYDHTVSEESGFVLPDVRQAVSGPIVSIVPPVGGQVLPTRFTETSGALPYPLTIGGAATVSMQLPDSQLVVLPEA